MNIIEIPISKNIKFNIPKTINKKDKLYYELWVVNVNESFSPGTLVYFYGTYKQTIKEIKKYIAKHKNICYVWLNVQLTDIATYTDFLKNNLCISYKKKSYFEFGTRIESTFERNKKTYFLCAQFYADSENFEGEHFASEYYKGALFDAKTKKLIINGGKSTLDEFIKLLKTELDIK